MPVYKRGNTWWVKFQVGGCEPIRRSAGKGATREEAKKLEAELRTEIRNEQRGIHSLDSAIARWVDGETRVLKSRRKLLEHLTVIRPFCAGKLLVEAPAVAQEFVSDRAGKCRPATINRKLAILKRVCGLAYQEWGWLNQPLHQKIRLLPENNKKGTFCTVEQVAAIVENCKSEEAKKAVRLAAFTGLRRSELFSAAFSGGALHLKDTKSGRSRAVPVPERVMADAAALPLRITVSALRVNFEQARAAIGLKHVRFHDLRHTYASLLIQAGASLSLVQRLMGHSTIAITNDLYGHLTTEHLEAAVRLLDKL